MGRARLFTTFDAAAGGAIVNQVERVFNGFGWITAEYQEHAGAVVRATSPKVRYDYAMANGGGRLLKMTYPTESRFLVYQYGAGINDNISRISAIADSAVGGGVVESYHYLGLGTIVQRNQPQVGEKLTFIRQAGDAAAAGNDRYSGLDRFGRIIDQNWVRTAASAGGAAGTSSVRLQYQYDRAGNAIARHDLIDAALSELYEYDPLNRLISFKRGAPSAAPTLQQSWDLDALGNWSGTATGGATTNREFNVGNQTTAVSGGTAPTYDANGAVTSNDGKEYKYDAWGRLASVKAAGGSVLANYTYDALGRRAVEIHPGLRVNDVYFTPGWEVIEERTNTTTHLTVIGATGQIVFRDVYALGALGEDWRYYPRQNANGDVVALVKGAAPFAGYVLERHAYEPYGSMVVMAGDGTPRPGGTSYSWRVFFQGGRLDNVSGLYNFQFRDYDPHTGTWTTRDPIGLGGGDPNLYRFVANNPVNFVDPTGLAPDISFGPVAGAARTGAAAAGGFSKGLAQGGANVLNAGTNIAISTVNILPGAWNYTVGFIPGAPQAPYVPNPEWSEGLITDETPLCRSVSRGSADVGVGLGTLLLPLAKGRLPFGKSNVAKPRPAPSNPATPACPAKGTPNTPKQFQGTDKPWTSGATPDSTYTHIDPKTGRAVQNAIYDRNGKVIGHVDFKNHGPGAPSGHGHQFPQPGNPASGHGPGKPHIPNNQLPPGWDTLPPGVSPQKPIGQ